MEASEDLKCIENILKVHNQYRALHNSSPLRINEKLNEHAQQVAHSLSQKENWTMVHIPYGLNVYVGFAYDPCWRTSEESIQNWYHESKYYKYDEPQPKNLKNVRNFTQLVWKDSKSMGVGSVIEPNGKFYLVCSYDPPANVDGKFQHNVTLPTEVDIQIPSLEELEQNFTEPSEEVVQSMERLYAVPSEKLRVWMVWLANISDIADEWHKWLRIYIDLITRIAERLQMAADDIPEERKIEFAELPKDEQEMIEMLKNLTHQATLYRSYYKHWKNIADQIEKETARRKVIPTTKFQGMPDVELPVNATASETAQYSMRQTESAVAQPTTEETTATSAALMPTSSGIDSPATDAPGQETIENETGDLFAQPDEPETTPTTVTVESSDLVPLPEIVTASPAQEAAAKREAAEKLIMDMAGADENGPYFFYLRTEPDIDIAIEHNDEKVIPPHPDLERISTNRKYLYFNLTDE